MTSRSSTATLAAETLPVAVRRDPAEAPARTPITAFRAALLLLCAALSAVASERTYAALPIAVLAGLTLAADRSARARAHPLALALVEAVLTGLSVVLTGGSDSPMLPYLLAAPASVGLPGAVRAVVVVSGAASAALLVGRALVGPSPLSASDPLEEFALAGAQWVLLGLALGLLATRARALTTAPSDLQDRYAEARGLLEQLRAVSRRLPGGLDAASAAESLLADLDRAAPSARSAVLVQPNGGSLVPIAVRGTRRVPWRAPLSEPGPLQHAWTNGVPVVDRRDCDLDGRRRGSALAVVPLLSSGAPFGLVVAESYAPDAFPPVVVEQLRRQVHHAALRLETALLFEEVRSTVTLEERDRLAHQMHDGVAQDLASIGYQLDDLRLQAGKVDEGLGQRVAQLRKDLTQLISDLRLRITDLRTSVGSERALGSALSSYIRAVGSGQPLTVHLSLEESPFRLPAEHEVLLLQIAQAVAQDVRRGGADNLWVRLAVDPPRARLVVEHDGAEHVTDLDAHAARLSSLGGTLVVTDRTGGGVRVEALLEGGSDGEDDRDAS